MNDDSSGSSVTRKRYHTCLCRPAELATSSESSLATDLICVATANTPPPSERSGLDSVNTVEGDSRVIRFLSSKLMVTAKNEQHAQPGRSPSALQSSKVYETPLNHSAQPRCQAYGSLGIVIVLFTPHNLACKLDDLSHLYPDETES